MTEPGADVEPLPMFPLGTVLFPSMLLPLRIFEPRYRTMIRHCLDGDARFGVVLIERGSEVGGGEVRSDIGCVARVVRAEERSDGQWMLMAIGTKRLRVEQWLDDDPFPQAMVRHWCDPDPAPDLGDRLDELEPAFRTVLALASELDEWSVPFGVELDTDPRLALYQMCAASPLGPFDRQRLLGADDCHERARLLGRLLADTAELLRVRLGQG